MTHDLLQFIKLSQKISVDYLKNNEIMTMVAKMKIMKLKK